MRSEGGTVQHMIREERLTPRSVAALDARACEGRPSRTSASPDNNTTSSALALSASHLPIFLIANSFNSYNSQSRPVNQNSKNMANQTGKNSVGSCLIECASRMEYEAYSGKQLSSASHKSQLTSSHQRSTWPRTVITSSRRARMTLS